MAARPAACVRWAVRLSVTRRGGWLASAARSGDFERALASAAGPAVIEPRLDAETRRGRDYVRVTVAMTIRAPDVAEALAIAWGVFRRGRATRGAGTFRALPPSSAPRRRASGWALLRKSRPSPLSTVDRPFHKRPRQCKYAYERDQAS